jgi:hypothetical protein
VREQPGGVVQRQRRQQRVAALLVHQRLAVLPQRLVHVHARAVLLEDRLRHERRGLAGLLGRVLDDVLVQLERVGHVDQGQEAQVDLTLAGAADLVVVALGADPERLEHEHHRGPQVAQRVVRRGREVALLRAVRVAERGQALAAALESLARRPVALLGVDLIERGVRLLVERHVVEDVELGLGPEVHGVGDAARAQVLGGLDRDVAGVARVRLARDRVDHRADHRDRRRRVERVQDRRRRVGHQQHVRLVDLLEAADRRAVEADPVAERVLVEARERHSHVLPGARQVGELEVHQVRVVALGKVEHVARLRFPPARERAHVKGLARPPGKDISNGHGRSSLGSLSRNIRPVDRMEKGRPRIFDIGTKTPGRSGTTMSTGWFSTEED